MIAGQTGMIIAFIAAAGMFFGGGRDRPNIFVTIALMLIMPMVASIIQMTVSRNREFIADAGALK